MENRENNEVRAEETAAETEQKKRDRKDKRFYRRAHRALAGFFRFILRVKVINRENFPKEGGCLVCLNHIGAADVIAASAVCSRQIRYLAKKELFSVPVVGWLVRRLGACPLDRSGSDVAAIRKSISLVEEGEMVALFPQGHRQPGKNPIDTPIRSGAGMIAHRAKCPILPVCIRMKKMRYAPFRRVEVIVGELIPYEDLGLKEGGREAYEAATARVFREICRLGGFPTEPSGEVDK